MAQYLLSVHQDGVTPPPSDEEMPAMFAAVEAVNDQIRQAGQWVFAGGLHPIDAATVVDATREGEPLVTDGPFSESKEYLGGFWVITAADLDEALSWATRCSKACGGPVEVRPFQDE